MPYDVGYRLMTANLSDVAAMGGIPRQIVLSVAAPDHVNTVILDEIYRGIKDQCMRYQLNILGGDTAVAYTHLDVYKRQILQVSHLHGNNNVIRI